MLSSARRLLRDDRHQRIWFRERLGIFKVPGKRNWSSGSARIKFLSRSKRRSPTSPVRILQKKRYAGRSRKEAEESSQVAARPNRASFPLVIPSGHSPRGICFPHLKVGAPFYFAFFAK